MLTPIWVVLFLMSTLWYWHRTLFPCDWIWLPWSLNWLKFKCLTKKSNFIYMSTNALNFSDWISTDSDQKNKRNYIWEYFAYSE
jgi:hypothetical protein